MLADNTSVTIVALRSVRDSADQFREEHPTLATVGGVALMVGSGIVIVPAVEAALLLAAGFGPLGPIAGESYYYPSTNYWLTWPFNCYRYTGTVAAVHLLGCAYWRALLYPAVCWDDYRRAVCHSNDRGGCRC
jgi:hypothetical protein